MELSLPQWGSGGMAELRSCTCPSLFIVGICADALEAPNGPRPPWIPDHPRIARNNLWRVPNPVGAKPLVAASAFVRRTVQVTIGSDEGVRSSEKGRTRFRRARLQTPNSVSFSGPHRVPGRELSEFLSAYYLCAKANSPSFRRTHRVCTKTQWVPQKII